MNDIIKNTCKIGQGSKCCKYLAVGSNGFEWGYSKKKKVTKADIANFLVNIVEADMQDLETEGN